MDVLEEPNGQRAVAVLSNWNPCPSSQAIEEILKVAVKHVEEDAPHIECYRQPWHTC